MLKKTFSLVDERRQFNIDVQKSKQIRRNETNESTNIKQQKKY